MIIIIKIMLIMLGIYLATELMAAFYAILDLWYTIKSAYPKIILRILAWSGLTITIAILLGNQWRNVFLWSMLIFMILFLINFYSIQLLIRFVNRPKSIK